MKGKKPGVVNGEALHAGDTGAPFTDSCHVGKDDEVWLFLYATCQGND